MPCMCGDTHCWSCGPAQGNTRCPICGAWADDGCEHIDEETGQIKPEHVAEARAIDEAEAAQEAEMDRRQAEYERMCAEEGDVL